jgi:putative ABC transport system permease protein
VPYLSGPYAPALLNDFPTEIKKAVRVRPVTGLISFQDKGYNEGKVYMTDDNFFTLFSFPLIKGDPATVLKEPGSVVITEKTAKKYFGNEDPIGKVVQFDKELSLKVTGVAKDVPLNSHLNFDLIIPISNVAREEWFNVWINNNQFVYVLLDKGSDKARLEQQFPAFMHKYMGADMARFGAKFDLKLNPLTDIYFEPASAFDDVRHGDKKVVLIFLSIAVLILLIACINFMNLSTIRAVERSKEVGLRKVMGALRNHLVWQFIGESFLLATISCILAIGLLHLLMPWYNELLGYSLTVSWNSLPIYLFLLGVIVLVGFLAGSYPAFVLSAFSPIEALKGKLRLGTGGVFFRQALVVVQFSISVLLIIGTITIMNQMRYVKNKELGFHKEHTVVVPISNNDLYDRRWTFKNELLNDKYVGSVSIMSGVPGGFHDIHNFEVEGANDQVLKLRTEFADFEYVPTLGLKIIAGRNMSGKFPTDTTESVLINRTAAVKLGFTPEQAIGKWIRNTIRDQSKRRIVGVVEDFNFRSLKERMDPLVISPAEDNRVIAIRLKTGNDIKEALEDIRTTYSKLVPDYPFEFEFLDVNFDSIYKADERQQTLMGVFSGLAIFIACLGLFGLASFTAAKRTKEIGVRKVLGSSISGIVVLLSKDLLKPVVLAILVAIPIGYYAMHNWLQNFAYRAPMQWWVFVLAGLIAASIALLTVSFQAIKAAVVNPVKSLRSE